ncbi:Cleavage and polyadenylation specificity factor, partial [Reticulomyxa filosa]
MSCKIEFMSVFGSGEFEPLCYLLVIDGVRLLLDCGWNMSFDKRAIENMEKKVDLKLIDAVLLSQPDVWHMGLLPYVYSQLGLDAPIYATAPVWRMGMYGLLDALVSKHEQEADFDLFTVDDICMVFEKKFAAKMKYSQELTVNGVTICPLNSGHKIGGTVWRMSKDTEVIVYGCDHNIRRERHLNASVFSGLGQGIDRPSVLICDAYDEKRRGGGGQQQMKRDVRDKEFVTSVLTALHRGGNVLVPSDAAGRCLEIILLLYEHFVEQRLFEQFQMCFLSFTSKGVLECAKSMLEWMSDACQNALNNKGKNAFDLKHSVIIASSWQDFDHKVKKSLPF